VTEARGGSAEEPLDCFARQDCMFSLGRDPGVNLRVVPAARYDARSGVGTPADKEVQRDTRDARAPGEKSALREHRVRPRVIDRPTDQQ
jgi:hypothetical protein